MSQITKIRISGLFLFLGLLVITGCGSSSSNSAAPFDVDAGTHPLGWLPAGHMNSARTDIATCRECHGEDLSGGISKVSCTTCHIGGATSMHPSTWTDDGTTNAGIIQEHPGYVQVNGEKSCKNIYCHGEFLQGVANSGPSCANFANDSRCHQAIPPDPTAP